jgi:hypothetical protein
MNNGRQWNRFAAGDLVSWTIDDSKVTGMVIEVYPANIYDKEVCRILAEGRTYNVTSLYLSHHKKEPD